MTAVNLNVLGNVGQVNQPVQVRDTKEAAAKGDFEKVIKDRVSTSNTPDRLKAEETVKQPAKRTEVKNEGMSKAKSLVKKKENEMPQKDSDAVETANEILAGAAQILNVTPEELKAAMDSLELSVGDLTDRNNVAQLILLLNGSTDISDMLVDNGMLETFNELNDFISETLADEGLKPDEFKAMIELVNQGQVTNEQTVVNELEPAEEENELKTDVEQDSSNEVISAENAKEPEVIVEDNRGASENRNSSGSESGRDTVRTDYRESQTASAAENFVRNLETVVEETGEAETQPEMREIVYQVVQRIRVQLNPDSSNLEMRLNPENLGRVSINITSKAGVMTAQINTENRQAKEAIESSLQILKENIEAKGIKVEAVEVRVSDFNLADSRNSESSAEDNRSEGGRGRRNNGIIGSGDAEEAVENDSSEETILDPASTVSYRA